MIRFENGIFSLETENLGYYMVQFCIPRQLSSEECWAQSVSN